MPRYTVTIPQDLVSDLQKKKIAATITEVHENVTRAHSDKLQVILGDVEPGCFYQHGRLLECDHIFVHGFTSQDRDRDTKSALVEQLTAGIATAADVEPDAVSVFISEMSPAEMAEFDRLALRS
jgi:phenylpyruvate tautomerase PptA (4-oxalocrotonate tautomerase family)